MASALGYLQLCRLCLVKDKVNVPIFGDPNDSRQLFLKISACLPVKISREDNLPKNICDTCLYKVDLLYQFWNTTVNAEKQLTQWLGEIGVDVNLKPSDSSHLPIVGQSHAHPHSMASETMTFKEERHDPEIGAIEQKMQGYPQNQHMYSEYDMQYQQQATAPSIDNATNFSNAKPVVDEKPEISEPPAKRTRGRPPKAAAKKKPAAAKPPAKKRKPPIEDSTDESMDESSSDKLGMENDSDDDIDATEDTITKEEAESDEEYVDNPLPMETAFVGVPSTSTCDTEQPGPSGINKPATTTTATTDPGTDNDEMESKSILQRLLKTPSNVQYMQPIHGLVCTVCNKIFKNREKYTKHKKTHGERKVPCPICGKNFRSTYQVRVHERTHNADKIYKCESCNKSFKTKGGFELHERRHSADYKIKCSKCGKGFFYETTYKQHYEVHHNGLRYECNHCNKKFIGERYYKEHLKSHDANYVRRKYKRVKEKIICEICGKVSSSVYTLRIHMKTHMSEKPFACNMCKKAFKNKRFLKLHLRSHTNERPYSCSQCNKTFTQRTSLVIHMRYHTGVKPYKCDFCQKNFVSRTLLNSHRRNHK